MRDSSKLRIKIVFSKHKLFIIVIATSHLSYIIGKIVKSIKMLLSGN